MVRFRFLFPVFWLAVIGLLLSASVRAQTPHVQRPSKQVLSKELADGAVPLLPPDPDRAPSRGDLTLALDGGVTLVLKAITAGTFMMGSPVAEDGRDGNEGPRTRVTITKGFLLGQTEVTQAQWQAVMVNNPSAFPGADRPVERVSWENAMEFCRKLTDQQQATGRLPAGHSYTLPTEAQWEYACRAGTSGRFSGTPDAMGWYFSNWGNETKPVRQKQANVWGLYDMHGNVWEWCSDIYEDKLPGGTVSDPKGASAGSHRVLRGGSWFSAAENCRSAVRDRREPDDYDYNLGFRLVLNSLP